MINFQAQQRSRDNRQMMPKINKAVFKGKIIVTCSLIGYDALCEIVLIIVCVQIIGSKLGISHKNEVVKPIAERYRSE